jgi:hypothetical protein
MASWNCLNGRNAPSLRFKDYQEMMQTYKIPAINPQQKMQYSLSNKNWIRLNGLLMPFANVKTLFVTMNAIMHYQEFFLVVISSRNR